MAALCLLWTAGLPCTDCIDCNAGSYTAPGTCVDLLVGGVAWEDEFYRNCGFFYNAFTCSSYKNRSPDSGLYCCTCGGGETQVSETCLECPTNSNSPVGSSVSTACTCNAGSTGPDGGTCLFCVAGKYTALVGSTACVDCEVGTYSASVGATQSSTCRTCPANSNSLLGSSAATACTCNAGSGGPTLVTKISFVERDSDDNILSTIDKCQSTGTTAASYTEPQNLVDSERNEGIIKDGVGNYLNDMNCE